MELDLQVSPEEIMSREVEPSLFCPHTPLSPSLISHLASVDIKQNDPFRITRDKGALSLPESGE